MACVYTVVTSMWGTAGAFGVNDVSAVDTNPVFRWQVNILTYQFTELWLRLQSGPLIWKICCIRPMLKEWHFSSIFVCRCRIYPFGVCLHFNSLYTVTSYIILCSTNNYTEQSPSWEANGSSASQEIPPPHPHPISWNPKVHYRISQATATCPYTEPDQTRPCPNSLYWI